LPETSIASAVRGLALAAVFAVGAMAEIVVSGGLPPHCAVLTVESAGRTPWTVGEIVVIVGPALLIAILAYVVLQTPIRATRSSTGASVSWAVLTGVVIAAIGVLFEGMGTVC